MSNQREFMENFINDSLEHKKVTVYFRLVNSKSFKVSLPVNQTLTNIKMRIEQLIGIKPQYQVLFCKGKELVEDNMVTLTEKTIIHVKNIKENMEELTVNIVKHLPQTLNLFKATHQANAQIKINRNSTIQEFLNIFLKDCSEHIDIKGIKVIECGRYLHLHKSFLEENIQSQTELHLILAKNINNENEKENDQDQTFLIESILKKSRQNYSCERQPKINTVSLEITQNSQVDNITQDKVYQIQKRKTDDSAEAASENGKILRRVTSNYLAPTKSFEECQSKKIMKRQQNPLKFCMREYKKYNGVKSQRSCNCKRRQAFFAFSECYIKPQEEQTHIETSRPKIPRSKKQTQTSTLM